MEVLKLYIHVNGCEKVESECATVQMISFDGRCDGDYFRGEILPGGVDTQIYYTLYQVPPPNVCLYEL